MAFALDFIIAAFKISVVPIVAFVLVALAMGMHDQFGGDDRLGHLAVCVTLLVVTILNAIVFWRKGMHRAAIVGGGMWIAYAFACFLMLLAFWGG